MNEPQPRETEVVSDKIRITFTGRSIQFFCPCCTDVNLEIGKLGETEVGCCPNCRGFVIDMPTFGAQVDELRAGYQGADDKPVPIKPEELEVHRNCPACTEPMDVHPYYGPGSVVIDSCRNCKLVWFNEGELSRIIRAPGIRKRVVPTSLSDSSSLSVLKPAPTLSPVDPTQELLNTFLRALLR